MSVNEIIQELPRLTPEDRNLLRQELDERYLQDYEETPEMLAAVDEGLRSLREESTFTLEEVRKEMLTWELRHNPSKKSGLSPSISTSKVHP